MKLSYKKQIFFTSIALVVICLLIMIFIFYLKDNKHEEVGILKNSLTDENDTLELSGRLPLSDYVVKNKDILTFDEDVVDYVSFKVTSEGYNGDFTIFVEDCNEDNEKAIEDGYIKVLVTDSNNNLLSTTANGPVNSIKKLKVYPNKLSKKIVYIDNIKSGMEKNYILKAWVDNTFLADEEKNYCLKVSVE